MSIATTTNRSLLAGLYRALDPLCEETCDAVRIACVPNGAEHRFIVRIDERWRPDVYCLLAERTSVAIPADGGPLNLSAAEAHEVAQLTTVLVAERPVPERPADRPLADRPMADRVEPLPLRTPRHMPDIRGGALEHTFQ
ncbi:MAG TPA: hypothetical protein VD791_01475 [Burkholderiales bacterium]|nr:hypothetical protein [Burkholderiales bacterium]